MPKELRHDPEIDAKLQELERASKLYMAFDMQKLQHDMNRELETQISTFGKDYQAHHREVQGRLANCDQLNKQSL